jgi:hypothetical protein
VCHRSLQPGVRDDWSTGRKGTDDLHTPLAMRPCQHLAVHPLLKLHMQFWPLQKLDTQGFGYE